MSHHARRQIREKVVELCTGLTKTGARVYPSRVNPIEKAAEPTLLIYTLLEDADLDTMPRPRKLLRSLTIAIHGVVQASDGFDDICDAIAVDVEGAIGANPTLDGLVKDCHLVRTQISLGGENSATPVAGIRLDFAVLYRTTETAPQTIIS